MESSRKISSCGFLDSSGRPVSYGYLYLFKPGTKERLVSYADKDQAIANQHPIPLDHEGNADIFLEEGVKTYDVLLTDAEKHSILYTTVIPTQLDRIEEKLDRLLER
jgi:hypothetical protein